MTRIQRLKTYAMKYREYAPWWGLGVITNAVAIYLISVSRIYNSDDVGPQVVFRLMRHLGLSGSTIWVGPDNFVLKLPFYWFVSLLHVSPRMQLFLTNLTFVLFTFAIFGLILGWYCKRYAIRPWLYGVTYFYICVSSIAAWKFLANPNFRLPEFGFVFLIIAWMLAVYRHKSGWKIELPTALLVATYAGLLIYSDPYFKYIFFVPTLLFVGWRLLSKKILRQDLVVGGTILLSLGLADVWTKVITNGLHYYRVGDSLVPAIIGIKQLGPNILSAITAALTLFGGNIFGIQFYTHAQDWITLNALILAGMLAAALLVVFRQPKEQAEPNWPAYFALQVAFTPLILIIANWPEGITYRYFLSWVFFLPFAFLYSVRRANLRQSLAIALIIGFAAIINFCQIYSSKKAAPPSPNQDQIALNAAVQREGLTKGYAPYWTALISMYLASNKIDYIQTYCDSGLQRFNWWLDDKVSALPAQSTFIVIDNNDPIVHCSEDQIVSQFGSPAKRIVVSNRYILLVYNHDVTKDLGEPLTP